jgi:N-acetylglucosaminyldiphosphoundecaprenol N-acetyl-beta-D-mannosaminyltransferase
VTTQVKIAPHPPCDLTREVYGLLGVPVDPIKMAEVIERVENASANSTPFLISTANLNFLITSRSDAEFRESLLRSDLCTADGMPLVWIARLLGVPIKERIAGADIFEALKSAREPVGRLGVFIFGGAEGAAAAACQRLNTESAGIICVGSHDPGFVALEGMSTDAILNTINSSNADFLAVALGAKKGQFWLLRNHERLTIPVRAHLGATINFQAGRLKRAPPRLQKWGLEWLWRIKEEPALWRRYWHDGLQLLELILIQVVPLLALNWWYQPRWGQKGQDLLIEQAVDHKSVILSINGDAVARNIGIAVAGFEKAVAGKEPLIINFTKTRLIDARFLGLLIMLRKLLKGQRRHLSFTGASPRIAKIIRLNGFGFLLHS